MSVIQDVTSAPLLLILLVFFGETPQSAGAITLAIGEVFGIAAVTYILGRLVWPRILEWVSRFGTGEITLLATLALALGGAVAVNALGLSFAVGAFLAGLVVAGSSYKQEAISRILPLRDVFTALFFVSIGVFLNPTIIVDEPWLFMGLLGAVILAKGLISAGVVSIFRYPGRTAILSGFLLAQMGEFAFVLAIIGLDRGVVDESFFSLVIAVAIVSIGANSLLLDSTSPMLTVFTKAKEVALRLKPRRGA